MLVAINYVLYPFISFLYIVIDSGLKRTSAIKASARDAEQIIATVVEDGERTATEMNRTSVELNDA